MSREVSTGIRRPDREWRPCRWGQARPESGRSKVARSLYTDTAAESRNQIRLIDRYLSVIVAARESSGVAQPDLHSYRSQGFEVMSDVHKNETATPVFESDRMIILLRDQFVGAP